jgi:hypothetical protein
MSLNDFVFVKPPVSVPIVLQTTVITLSFLLFEISEVTMAAMRRNHTGQRHRSNESFTSPTSGSAFRQVACNSFEISNDLENLDPNTSTPVSTLNTATPTSSASSSVSIKTSKSNNQGKLNIIETVINPDNVLICPFAEKKLDESCYLKGYLKNVKDCHKDMFVLIEHGGHSYPHCVSEHMLLLKKD